MLSHSNSTLSHSNSTLSHSDSMLRHSNSNNNSTCKKLFMSNLLQRIRVAGQQRQKRKCQ